MSYFENSQDRIIYGPTFNTLKANKEIPLWEKKLKDRALKEKKWRYWRNPIKISSMSIHHLKKAIEVCKIFNNPKLTWGYSRYSGFLPLLEEELRKR